MYFLQGISRRNCSSRVVGQPTTDQETCKDLAMTINEINQRQRPGVTEKYFTRKNSRKLPVKNHPKVRNVSASLMRSPACTSLPSTNHSRPVHETLWKVSGLNLISSLSRNQKVLMLLDPRVRPTGLCESWLIEDSTKDLEASAIRVACTLDRCCTVSSDIWPMV